MDEVPGTDLSSLPLAAAFVLLCALVLLHRRFPFSPTALAVFTVDTFASHFWFEFVGVVGSRLRPPSVPRGVLFWGG